MNYYIEQTFKNRGYLDNDAEFIKKMDDYSYDILKDMDVLTQFLYDIRERHERIVVLPDFDMDGIMSGVIGLAGLEELGFQVSLYMPHVSNGYGFGPEDIDEIMSLYPDCKAIITCDVGITCLEGIKRAKDLGLIVLVTDHHRQFAESEADCTIDAHRMDETYSHPDICGAYTLWKCLITFAERYEDGFMYSQINRLRMFAGMGTLSDSMPVLYENRKLIKDTLSIARTLCIDSAVLNLTGKYYYKCALSCFATILADTLKSNGYEVDEANDVINETFMHFNIIPVFNAGKRMEGDMYKIFGILLDGVSCMENWQYAKELNEKRKKLQRKRCDELLSSEQPYAPYIYIGNVEGGLKGLVAQELMNANGVPTCVVSETEEGTYEGSGRSLGGFPMLSILSGKYGIQCAGHEEAFGVVFTEADLDVWYAAVQVELATAVTTTEPVYDFEISSDEINVPVMFEYLQELEYWRPFGPGFPAPYIKLHIDGTGCVSQKLPNKKGGIPHLKIRPSSNVSIICWNQGNMKIESSKSYSVVGAFEKNEYNGKITLQFIGNISED